MVSSRLLKAAGQTVNSGKSRWIRSKRSFSSVAAAFALLCGSCLAQSPPKSRVEIDRERVRLKVPPPSSNPVPDKPETATHQFRIPDGTPIRLRLTQPVRGMTRSLVKTKVYSREGDIVRLVAADDVRVKGVVVISKGAIAQATVTKVQDPGFGSPSGGNYQKGQAVLLLLPKAGTVSLQLDWVESVTGEDIPLRALPTGESKPFVMSVSAERGGMIVRPSATKRDLHDFLTGHLRNWAPTGSRLAAYVDGVTEVDPEDLKQAQEVLPVPAGDGILTIYRGAGQSTEHVLVSCDEKRIAALGEWQYVALEIQPGKHTCRVGQQKPVEFTADAGEQYFLHIRPKGGNWIVDRVDVDEGEDGTANGQLVEAENTESFRTENSAASPAFP